MMFNVVYALGELAILYPISGGFYTYSVRFIDPSWGFAMGYNYVFQWAIVLPLELVVAGLTLRFWDQDASVHVAVWVSASFYCLRWLIPRSMGADGVASTSRSPYSLSLLLSLVSSEFWATLRKNSGLQY